MDEHGTEIVGDANVAAVCEKHRARADKGLSKYGVTTERGDLTLREWLQHAQDEAMDLSVYLQRLMDDLPISKTPSPAVEALAGCAARALSWEGMLNNAEQLRKLGQGDEAREIRRQVVNERQELVEALSRIKQQGGG